MILNVKVSNWPIHGDFELKFDSGLISIHGHSETGKTLILEAVNFALWGTQALRLPAKFYGKISVQLTLEISGSIYKIDRSLSMAVLTKPADPEYKVQGTTPVNQEVQNLFGFGFKVFLSSVYSRQGEIRYLSKLSAVERRKVINGMLGLEGVEASLKEYKEQLKAAKAKVEYLSSSITVPVKPEKPLYGADQNLILEEAKSLTTQLKEWSDYFAVKNALQRNAIPEPKKVEFVEGNIDQLNKAVADIFVLESGLRSLSETISSTERKRKGYLKEIEGKEPYDLVKLEAETNLYRDSHQKKLLQSKGVVVCEVCNHKNFLASDSLKQYDHVPDQVEKPSVSLEQAKTLNSYFQAVVDIEQELVGFKESKVRLEGKLSSLISTYGSPELIREKIQAIKAYENYAIDLKRYQAWQNQVAELKEPDLLPVGMLEEAKQANDLALREFIQLETLWKTYDQLQADYERKQLLVKKAVADKEELEKVVAGFQLMHQQIKGHLLPSVNQLASALLTKLSSGKHTKIELTENIDVLVDAGEPIEILSGSGGALAFLSLRIALGSVLTNKVFPVMIFDEVDEGMCSLRSHNVMESLRSLLGKCSQIFVISHKNVENADQYISVPLEI